jgi:hypothetical protein
MTGNDWHRVLDALRYACPGCGGSGKATGAPDHWVDGIIHVDGIPHTARIAIYEPCNRCRGGGGV